jgi:DNA polymerase elongation subunit (family B)
MQKTARTTRSYGFVDLLPVGGISVLLLKGFFFEIKRSIDTMNDDNGGGTAMYVMEWVCGDFTDGPDDDDDPSFCIRAYGRLLDGSKKRLDISFYPYFFVKVPDSWSEARQRGFLHDAVRMYGADPALSVARLMRKDAWGYGGGRQEPFVQLAFGTLKAARIARFRLAKAGFQLYESNVDPVVRLCHVRGISPTGWISVALSSLSSSKVHFTDVSPLGGPAADLPPPPFVLCSWDIECVSASGGFPQADCPDDRIIQIASAFQRMGDLEPYAKVVVALDTCAHVADDVEVVAVATEAEVLTAWVDLLEKHETDVLMGWNTWGFDWRYVRGRTHVLTDDDGAPSVDLSHFLGEPRDWELNSGAYGQNKYSSVTCPGVLDLDLMQLVRRDHKLESYALNAVSKKFLDGECKLDLPAGEIFRKFRGSAEDRADIARYAVQDVLLPLKLFGRLSVFENLAQMSIATCVPMDYLLSRGQQQRVYSLVLKQARAMGFVLPDDKGITIEGKFEGATVLDAKRGAYFSVISGLDFASLYPSIIRAHNLCYSTLIMEGRSPEPPPDAPPPFEVVTGLGTYRFAQDTPGIVPELLKNLAVWRKDAKRKMAEAKRAGDAWGASVWNSAQLAFKVSANSVYGFMGASKGFLPCVPIAAAVTATGRLMIEKTKRLAEEMVPGSRVVYGDSVAPWTPVFVRTATGVGLVTVDDAAAELVWTPDGDKETARCPPDWQIWSEDGWTHVWCMVRHLVPARRLRRVCTPRAVIDVTEDHSLLEAEDARPIAPRDIVVGRTRLLHASLPSFFQEAEAPVDAVEARLMGFFLARGRCEALPPRTRWTLCHPDASTLDGYLARCKRAYPRLVWRLRGTDIVMPEDDGSGTLRRQLCDRYLRHAYNARGDKIVPRGVLCARDPELKRSFWDGWVDGGAFARTQIAAAGLFAVAGAIETSSVVVCRCSDDNRYAVGPAEGQTRDDVVTVLEAHRRDDDDATVHVYDFTTSNHHFAAGVGEMVVHNTDSVMVQFHVEDPRKRDDVATHFEIAQRVADAISKTFPPPIELEFEKCYFPYLLFSKKRYAGLMYTRPEAPDAIDVKGLQLVRRDNAPIVKKASQGILDAIMHERSADKAVEAARRAVLDVVSGREPLESFVVSKSLRGSYANPNAQPHVQVARKIRERTGEALASGERVPYVFVVDDNIGGLISSRAEDPAHVREHGLALDYLYYVENQLLSPITALLEVLVDDPATTVMGAPEIAAIVQGMRRSRDRLVKEVKRVKTNAKNRQHEITKFFTKAV